MAEPLDGIPHLKLSPQKLIPVLEAVRAHQPDRQAIEASVVGLFPDMEAKSVFRGMAIPAITRLDLVRSVDGSLSLSPNGTEAFADRLPAPDYVSLAIRAVAARRFDLDARQLSHPEALLLDSSGTSPSVRERAVRFSGYLRGFPVRRHVWSDAGFRHLPNQEFRTEIPDKKGEEVLVRMLPKGRIIGVDSVRELLMRELRGEDWLVTSFDVDSMVSSLYQRKAHVIRLWQQADRSIDELLIGGRSYGSLTLL